MKFKDLSYDPYLYLSQKFYHCAEMQFKCAHFLCLLRSIAAHRDHFVWRLFVRRSVCLCVCLSSSHTFLAVTQSYVSKVTHAFLGMLPLCLVQVLLIIVEKIDIFHQYLFLIHSLVCFAGLLLMCWKLLLIFTGFGLRGRPWVRALRHSPRSRRWHRRFDRWVRGHEWQWTRDGHC